MRRMVVIGLVLALVLGLVGPEAQAGRRRKNRAHHSVTRLHKDRTSAPALRGRTCWRATWSFRAENVFGGYLWRQSIFINWCSRRGHVVRRSVRTGIPGDTGGQLWNSWKRDKASIQARTVRPHRVYLRGWARYEACLPKIGWCASKDGWLALQVSDDGRVTHHGKGDWGV
jgi:hypothetical protein